MSTSEKIDQGRIEAALRGAFEAVLPSLVREVVARMEQPAIERPRPEPVSDLGPLFNEARRYGEPALRNLLDRPIEELRPIARALGRKFSDMARKSKDAKRVREAIVTEIMRRAFRNDVFLGPSSASLDSDDPHKPL